MHAIKCVIEETASLLWQTRNQTSPTPSPVD